MATSRQGTHSRTRLRFWAPLLIGAVLAISCRDRTDTEPFVPRTFNLMSVNGSTLPFVWMVIAGDTTYLNGETLYLRGNGTYLRTSIFEGRALEPTRQMFADAGFYRVRGSTIIIESSDGRTFELDLTVDGRLEGHIGDNLLIGRFYRFEEEIVNP
jgi:hypothetical protein